MKTHGGTSSQANLRYARLVSTNLERTNLTGCAIYGCSVWDLKISEATTQRDLVITPEGEAKITVDNLEVAQFIYLLLNNAQIRAVIDTITAKMVLILGRFTNERKRVLDALRAELLLHDYLPVLFDYEKPTNRDLTKAISTLAHMARFVIADITNATKVLPFTVRKIKEKWITHSALLPCSLRLIFKVVGVRSLCLSRQRAGCRCPQEQEGSEEKYTNCEARHDYIDGSGIASLTLSLPCGGVEKRHPRPTSRAANGNMLLLV